VMLCMLNAAEGVLRLLEVLRVMRCVVLCMLEVVETARYVCWRLFAELGRLT
jgi:hypothetical protein